MLVKKQQLEPDMEQQTGSKSGKEYVKAVCTSCEMPGQMKHKLESRFLEEISITSDMQMTPPLWQKERRTKELLDEGERGERKGWLQTQYSKN